MDIKIKKLIRDYQYNLETLDDIMEISVIAESGFRTALNEEDPEAVRALSPDENKKQEKAEKEKPPIIENGSKFKKLFRKAAVKCHPDKLTSDLSERDIIFMKGCYENLTQANDTNDWGLLLIVSMELDIEFSDLGDDEVDNINNRIEELKKSISQYENSMAYSWYNNNDEEQKKMYLAECAKIFRKSMGI